MVVAMAVVALAVVVTVVVEVMVVDVVEAAVEAAVVVTRISTVPLIYCFQNFTEIQVVECKPVSYTFFFEALPLNVAIIICFRIRLPSSGFLHSLRRLQLISGICHD